MDVSLTPTMAALVQEKVASGRFADPEAVVREALRALDRWDRLERLRAAVAVAAAEVERGEVVEWTPDFWAELRREAEEASRRGLPIDDDVKP